MADPIFGLRMPEVFPSTPLARSLVSQRTFDKPPDGFRALTYFKISPAGENPCKLLMFT